MKNQSVFFIVVFSIILFLTLTSKSFSNNLYLSVVSDSTQKEFSGEIESKKGKTIKVSVSDPANLPSVGTSGTLSKYFEEEILGFSTHGYIDIAEVEVISVSENIVTFSLIKELSEIKINGKKENHFKKGNIVKFTW
jgi:hypothetical protein